MADIFDTLDAPASDIFDQVAAEPSPNPLPGDEIRATTFGDTLNSWRSRAADELGRIASLGQTKEPTPLLPKWDVKQGAAGPVEQGITQSVYDQARGFITPEAIPQLAAGVATIPAFIGQRILSTPEQYGRIKDALRNGDSKDVATAITNELVPDVMAFLGVKHGAKKAFGRSDTTKAAQIEEELRKGGETRQPAFPSEANQQTIEPPIARPIGAEAQPLELPPAISEQRPSPESAPSAEIGKPDVFDEVAAQTRSGNQEQSPSAPYESGADLAAQSEKVSPSVSDTSAQTRQSREQPIQSQPTSTKNADTEQERSSRGIAPAEEVAAREFGTVWDEAKAKVAEDASAPRRLVESLADNPRALSDTENALLLHRQIEVQNEHDAAVKAVNAAPGDAEAQTRLDRVRDDLQATYDAARASGTESGRGLNARKMLANADYSLAKMEAETRAVVNKGRPLSPEQAADVAKLHERIAAAEAKIASYERSPRSIKRVAFQQAKAGRTFNDFLEEQAGKIRERRKPAQPETVKFARQPNESKRSIDKNTGSEYSLHDETRRAFEPSQDKSADLALAAIAGKIERDPAHGGLGRPTLTKVDLKGTTHQSDAASLAGIKTLARRSGTEIVYFRSDRPLRVNGASIGNKLLINVEAITDPVHVLAGHEVWHSIQRSDPQLAKAVKAALEIDRGKYGKYRENAQGKGYERHELTDEFMADLVGETLSDPAKLHQVIGSNLAKRVMVKVRDWISNALSFFKRNEQHYPTASAAVRNLEEVQARIVAALRGEGVRTGNPRSSLPQESHTLKGNRTLDQREQIGSSLSSEYPSLKSNDPSFARQQPKPAESDDLIIGASHIAKGAADYQAWAEAVRQDQVTPTPELYRQSKAWHDETAKMFRSPEQRRLDMLKSGTIKRTEELRSRLGAGDFAKRERNLTVPDQELLRLRAEHERAKDEYRHGLEQAQRSQRPFVKKLVDSFVDASRMLKLTGITTLGKLGGAGVTRLATTPLEQVTGAAIGKFPILRKVAAAAPREGGISLRAEGKALTSGVAQGFRDIPNILRGNRTDAEALAGEKLRTRSRLDYPGRIHGAIKAPFKEAERARSLEMRTRQAERQGFDVTDERIQDSIRRAANQDAKRAIFMQDNILSDFWNNGLRSMERSKKFPVGGYTLAKVGRFLLPIVKVPTNIGLEVGTYLGGVASASGRLIHVMRRGLHTIRPEEADMIMRHYKKGMVGAGLFLTGYFNAQNFGGFYEKGKKDDKEDLKHGQMRVAGVTVPAWLLHSPAMLVMQAGATAHKVTHGDKPKSAGSASLTVARGVTEQIPFMAELGVIDNMLADDYKGTSVRGRLLQGTIVPQGVKNIAEYGDKDSAGQPIIRKPKNELDYLKSAVPGLRQQVPTLEDHMRQQKWERKQAAIHRHLRGH